MLGRAERCEYCDDFPGSGKCSGCYGTGKNIHLNSDRTECEVCSGTGICQYCKAKQVFGPPLSRKVLGRMGQWLGRFFG